MDCLERWELEFVLEIGVDGLANCGGAVGEAPRAIRSEGCFLGKEGLGATSGLCGFAGTVAAFEDY